MQLAIYKTMLKLVTLTSEKPRNPEEILQLIIVGENELCVSAFGL